MKRLAIFCDGTWNQMSGPESTNVLLGAQTVLPADAVGVGQVTYYDEGVGTNSRWLETRLAGAFGWGLLEKVEAAYRFVIFNYEPGDEIFIFGFSRGAYTARSLAGLIRKCGVVPRTDAKRIREIFAFYKDAGTKPDSDDAQQFRMEHSPHVVLKEKDRDWRIAHGADTESTRKAPILSIKYVGVWDTVGALGVPQHLWVSKLFGTGKKYQFHDTELSSTVRSSRHAVAVDETRMSFAPSLWSNLDELNSAANSETAYQQLWFPGDHGSVGGGGDIRGLSNNAFVWIMEGAQAQGLACDKALLAQAAEKIDHFAPLHNSTAKEGLIERIYRRAGRDGPQQLSLLAESTRARLGRLETKANVDTWRPYRPDTLRRFWK